ncbi:MAG: response regulator [Myxococcota bacterium]
MKILIVDDSRAMRMIVRRTLRQAGYGQHDIEEAANGREGYEQIQKHTPDLVLCDWNMPEMTGIELLQQLKGEGHGVKFGFVTSESTEDMRAKASAAGALFLIAKPFTPDAFKGALEPHLGA